MHATKRRKPFKILAMRHSAFHPYVSGRFLAAMIFHCYGNFVRYNAVCLQSMAAWAGRV